VTKQEHVETAQTLEEVGQRLETLRGFL